MIRATLATLMLLGLGLITFGTPVSATCIDSNPDDDGVGTQGCNVPAGGDCKVLVYGSLPGIGSGCSPVACVRECVPHFPPYDCFDGVQDCDGTDS